MKRIFYIRHAKSSWADSSQRDIDRPLNARGKRDAPFMSDRLAQIIPEVDLLICSPARRAQDTSSFFKEAIKCQQIKNDDSVYHAPLSTLLNVMGSIDESVKTVLIFGHNPGFTSVFNHFSDQILDNLPTCGIFEIRSTSSWKEMTNQNSTTCNLLYPKMYK